MQWSDAGRKWPQIKALKKGFQKAYYTSTRIKMISSKQCTEQYRNNCRYNQSKKRTGTIHQILLQQLWRKMIGKRKPGQNTGEPKKSKIPENSWMWFRCWVSRSKVQDRSPFVLKCILREIISRHNTFQKSGHRGATAWLIYFKIPVKSSKNE